MSMGPMWEWLGRTRLMRKVIDAVESWFDRISDPELLRTRRESLPAHDQTHTLVWTDPLWANTTAITHVLASAYEDEWDPTQWAPDPHLNVTQMRYEADADHRRQEEEGQ